MDMMVTVGKFENALLKLREYATYLFEYKREMFFNRQGGLSV